MEGDLVLLSPTMMEGTFNMNRLLAPWTTENNIAWQCLPSDSHRRPLATNLWPPSDLAQFRHCLLTKPPTNMAIMQFKYGTILVLDGCDVENPAQTPDRLPLLAHDPPGFDAPVAVGTDGDHEDDCVLIPTRRDGDGIVIIEHATEHRPQEMLQRFADIEPIEPARIHHGRFYPKS